VSAHSKAILIYQASAVLRCARVAAGVKCVRVMVVGGGASCVSEAESAGLMVVAGGWQGLAELSAEDAKRGRAEKPSVRMGRVGMVRDAGMVRAVECAKRVRAVECAKRVRTVAYAKRVRGFAKRCARMVHAIMYCAVEVARRGTNSTDGSANFNEGNQVTESH
jgi:hypothetical protein